MFSLTWPPTRRRFRGLAPSKGCPRGVAPFRITQDAAPISAIPTLSSWGLVLLAGALALFGARRLAGLSLSAKGDLDG